MRQYFWIGLALLAACGSNVDLLPPPDPPDPPEWPPPPVPGPTWGKAVSGGTMLVTRNGGHAVIADPDRDRVVIVDLALRKSVRVVELDAGDEPGRVVEDATGRLHVALRRGGDLLTLASPTSGEPLRRRDVCPEPRGVAWEPSTDLVHVACRTGELVSLPASGGEPTRVLQLDRDLRDVVVVGDKLMLTRFKTSEVLTLDATGAVIERAASPEVTRQVFEPFTGEPKMVAAQPAVAWRAVPMPDGSGIVVAHQRARLAPLSLGDGGYGGDMCGGGPTEPTGTFFAPGLTPLASRGLSITTLPVDVAVSPDGLRLAFAMAGDETVRIVSSAMLTDGDRPPCEDPPEENIIFDSQGIPSSVAFTPSGHLGVFYPDHNLFALYELPFDGSASWIAVLPGERGYDMGRAVFHRQTFAALACATCHPEGDEDGRVWVFEGLGARRTQQIGGHILQRAPYHWDGDMADLSQLMGEVFVGRMGGSLQGSWEIEALGKWLDTIPAPAPRAGLDPAAVERGRTLFTSAQVGCSTCHTGAIFTSNLRFDVGTGGFFKVPSLLGVGARAPFLHDGCAATLRDRFTCGGGDAHGITSALSEEQIGDLVTFLESI